MIVPVFPLRGVFLFPGAILPLHIFEPRYRAMVDDLLDTAGRLVLATTVGDEDPGLEGAPPFHPVGGLGEISGHERLEDGRYLIVLYGLDRVRLEEVESDRPYRQVAAEPLVEQPLVGPQREDYRVKLEREVRRRGGDDLNIPDDFPTERLIDVLMMQSSASADRMAEVYSMVDLRQRADAALDLPHSPDRES